MLFDDKIGNSIVVVRHVFTYIFGKRTVGCMSCLWVRKIEAVVCYSVQFFQNRSRYSEHGGKKLAEPDRK